MSAKHLGNRLIPLFTLLLLLVSQYGCATKYTVSAIPNDFLIRSGDLLSVDVKIDSDEENWINDTSNASEICREECQQFGLDLDFSIYANVKGEGNISVGPYEVKIGKETIRTQTVRLLVLPSLSDDEGIFIEFVSDPNGSGKFQIRIDYNLPKDVIHAGPIVMNESKFLRCATGEGLIRHSSSRSASSISWSANYILENTTANPIIITKDYFKRLPENYILPKIIIPPSRAKGNDLTTNKGKLLNSKNNF